MCGECAYMIFIAYLLPVLEMERAQNLVFPIVSLPEMEVALEKVSGLASGLHLSCPAGPDVV